MILKYLKDNPLGGIIATILAVLTWNGSAEATAGPGADQPGHGEIA